MSGLPIVLLFVACCGFAAVVAYRSSPHLRGWPRRVRMAGVALFAAGAFGLAGTMIAAAGGMNWLPSRLEWPVGHASGIVTMRDGVHVVPLTHAGRIQLYDAQWRFLRGWQLDAGGGDFALNVLDGDKIQVAAVRLQRLYVFDADGRLLSERTYGKQAYDSFGRRGRSGFVPTFPLLWIWSGPFFSMLTAVLGGVFIRFAEVRRAPVVRRT